MIEIRCRFCRKPLGAPFVDLGNQPLANNYLKPGEEDRERTFPLVVRNCPSCLLVQADHSVPSDAIFTADYAYFSSYSTSWVEHARCFAEAMTARFGLSPISKVFEIASNDGYLLQHFRARNIPVLGVEPTAGTAAVAAAKGIPTEVAFFGRATAERLAAAGPRADLMAANNVLAHVPDIGDFIGGFSVLLAPQGVATFEFPHLLNLIERVQFDTIYHEHYSYLSLAAVERILAASNLRVFDIEPLATHGGSLRLFVCHQAASHIVTPAVAATRQAECAAGLDLADGAAYRDFAPKVAAARSSFLEFLATAKANGKTIAAYGAAAKGNTFLNYCGVTSADIDYVADASHAKQGRLLPGSHIPVISPAELTARRPDYVVILPWNLAEEISAQLAPMRAAGTRFAVAIPSMRML